MNIRVASLVQKRRTMMSSPLVMALPAGVRVVKFTMGCRAAALDFVNRVGASRGKEQLVEWLRGPYRSHVVTIAHASHRRIAPAVVRPSSVQKLLTRTRQQVGAAMLSLCDPEAGVAFAYEALASGLVYRGQDAKGVQGWVPVSYPRMRLLDRVLSLVAADHLMRPGDYETRLFQCSACEVLSFDAQRRALGVCAAHVAHANSDIRELAPSPNEPLAAAG
jgi:hypothetical protein